MGEIEKFCFRPSSSFSIAMTARLKRKKSLTNFFHFFCWEGLVHHNSVHGCDRKVLFSAFVIVFYSDDSQTKTKKIIDKLFFIFSAGRVWHTITPPMGEIEKFCFRPSSSFSIAMTARLKRKKIFDNFFFHFFCWEGLVHHNSAHG